MLAWLTFPSAGIYVEDHAFVLTIDISVFTPAQNLFPVTLLADIYSTLQAVMHKNMTVDMHVLSQALTHTDLTITSLIDTYFIMTRRATYIINIDFPDLAWTHTAFTGTD